jgi:hypothetical protein
MIGAVTLPTWAFVVGIVALVMAAIVICGAIFLEEPRSLNAVIGDLRPYRTLAGFVLIAAFEDDPVTGVPILVPIIAGDGIAGDHRAREAVAAVARRVAIRLEDDDVAPWAAPMDDPDGGRRAD